MSEQPGPPTFSPGHAHAIPLPAGIVKMGTVFAWTRVVGAVAKWLSVKANQDTQTQDWRHLRQIMDKGYPTPDDRLRALLTQLAADADHSELLLRMLNGEDPK